jgi:hypothetical protein
MPVSNNSIFNSIVKELYCPDFDLSEVRRFNIYKALYSDGYYSNCIQLTKADSTVICTVFMHYHVYTTSEDALNAIVQGYNYHMNDAKTVHAVLDWRQMNPNTIYNGNILMTNDYTKINLNPTIAGFVNCDWSNSFSPFYHISSAMLKNIKNIWYLVIRDRKGTTTHEMLGNLEIGIKKNTFGILNLKVIPFSDKCELEIKPMFDSADGGLSFFEYANIDLSNWLPTIGDGLISNHSLSGIVKGNTALANKHRPANCIVTWKNLFSKNDPNILNLSSIISFATNARNNKTKFSLVFMPSNLGVEYDAYISTDASGQNVYYHFPEWALDDIGQSKLHKITVKDVYTGNTITLYDLDWRHKTTRDAYLESCQVIVNALKNTSLPGDTKRIIDYIDIVKVAFIGPWGEGIKFFCDPSEIPSASDLEEVSNGIIGMFTEANPKIICLLSLSSFLNHDFPEAYREHIMSGPGLFYDSLGAHMSYFFQETNHGYEYSEEDMNRILLYHREKPIYLECTQYISEIDKPSFRNLISYVRYFRPTYLSVQNVLNNMNEDKFNTIAMIQELSRYVGTKLAILSYFFKVVKIWNEEDNEDEDYLQTGLRLLHCGTSKIYHGYWKLKYHVGTEAGTIAHSYNSDYNLCNIPAAFEEDSPNWHDARLIQDAKIPLTDLSQTTNTIYISIEDEDGICENLYLCNLSVSSYLPRTSNGLYKLFQYPIS